MQDKFFLLRDLDEDSILDRVEGAAGDPQVIGGSNLAGTSRLSSRIRVEFRWPRSASP
jgi:hypothetical protein